MLTCKTIDEHEALRDIKGPPPPPGVPMRRWRGGSGHGGSGGAALGWYRGKHAGWIEAVLALQKMGHTRIAEKLQKHFNLSDDGSIRL